MNKLLIGLLIVAAGTGIYFLLSKKNDKATSNEINKEWIIGKWAANSGTDSASGVDHFTFLKNGNIIRSSADSAGTDSSCYEWKNGSEILWREKPGDSTGKILSVVKLTRDSLRLMAADSSTILFMKIN